MIASATVSVTVERTRVTYMPGSASVLGPEERGTDTPTMTTSQLPRDTYLERAARPRRAGGGRAGGI